MVLSAVLCALCVFASQHPPDAKEILQKTLAAYSATKTYQGSWLFTLERGAAKQRTIMEIKSKAPASLYIRLSAAPGEKPVKGLEPISELQVVIDGKIAYFENSTSKEYYRVTLPKDPHISPLMFIPQIPAASAVKAAEQPSGDKKVYTVSADLEGGGTSRMEIDSTSFHIQRIVQETALGPIKMVSTLQADKETFDAEIPDATFRYKPPRGGKEIPAPPGAAALFGPR